MKTPTMSLYDLSPRWVNVYRNGRDGNHWYGIPHLSRKKAEEQINHKSRRPIYRIKVTLKEPRP